MTNTYKPQLLLNSVTGASGYISSTVYDPASRIITRSLGNGLTQAFNYNLWASQGGRLQAMSTGALQSLAYQYDLIGNITQIQDALTSETQTFGYDALYRLTSATASNGLAPYSESYTYDPATGNLASKTGVNYTYDLNHPHAVTSLSNGNNYQYDLNGNQVTRNIGSDSFSLLYDAENHLVEVKKNGLTIATFTYDGDGKRVKSVIGNETTLFVGRHYEVINGSVTKYYFAGDQRIAMRKNGTLYYLLSDHLGSTSITTDASGNKTSELKYKAWGEVRYSSGATPTKYTYTGQDSNVNDFGLMYYGARWYDSGLSRWTQPDQIIPNPQNPVDWDRYQYVRSNPVILIDPSGNRPCGDDYEREYGSCEPLERINSLQKVIYNYCGKAEGACYRDGVDWLKVDSGFAKGLGFSGVVWIPYDLNPTQTGRFPWEAIGNVTFSENEGLHPYAYNPGTDEYLYFRSRWISDAIGVMQTMINRARPGSNYACSGTSPSECATSGGYAAPNRRYTTAYGEFYLLAFIVSEVGIRVDQPYGSFTHQDLVAARLYYPGDINGPGVDTTAFGPSGGPFNFYVPPIPAIDIRLFIY